MKLKDDNYYKNYTNDELIDEIERGLRKGYWDKALIPELKKRFKEIEKKEKLLKLYIDLAIFYFGEIKYLWNKIKELENEKEE